ncbi:uncharacterized protein LOC127811829 [Diospyros lotus]|uniref:uncharacterized protein LOC127811829 n=1 Tax=Diospyros lotus TaxID=55363 RepID=UPI0022535B33|nr:uncharacterized protein LOC127811829 [Diospyros lotus]
MAVAGFSSSQPLIPIFNGEKYEWWSIKMKTLLRSHELWDLVEYGFVDIKPTTTISKHAWSILQKEFHGGSKVIVVRLQSLRRDFETLVMKNGESIAEFLSRVMAIVSQMCSYSEKIPDETIVAKVLRSLTPKFDHVVAVIEEAKDFLVFSVDELMGSLQAHESRINSSLEKKEEKAFQVKEIATKHGDKDCSASRGRGRGGSRGRGRGNDRGRGRNEG